MCAGFFVVGVSNEGLRKRGGFTLEQQVIISQLCIARGYKLTVFRE